MYEVTTVNGDTMVFPAAGIESAARMAERQWGKDVKITSILRVAQLTHPEAE